MDDLIDTPGFDIKGWRLAAIVEKSGPRRITADQAVEQREDKADAVFFLIDPLRAGAGLDGIYSAAREISEAELFKAAQKEVRRHLYGRRKTIDNVIKRAQRLGRRQLFMPWQDLILRDYRARKVRGSPLLVWDCGPSTGMRCQPRMSLIWLPLSQIGCCFTLTRNRHEIE